MKTIHKILLFWLVLNSISKGQTDFWEPTKGPFGSYAFSIAVSPNGHIFFASHQGIYRSTNKGIDWLLLSNSHSAPFQNIFVLPDSTIYCGVFDEYNDAEYFSTDDGLTWHNTNLSSTSKCVIMTSAGTLLAGPNGGIFRSSNHGSTWSLVLASEGSYCMAVKDNIVFASTIEGVFRSTNDGLTWKDIKDSLFVFPILALGIDKKGNILATGYDSFISSDNGDHWHKISNLHGSSIAFDSLGNIFVGGNSIFISSNYSQSWIVSDSGLPKLEITGISCDQDNYIYASCSREGIFRSTNNGITWQRINHGLTDISITSILITSEDSILVGTSSGVFLTSDQGDHWDQVIPANLYASYSILAKNSKGYFFTGTYPKGIYSSSDCGKTWTNCRPYFSYPLAIVTDNKNNVYVGSWQQGIIVTQDNGNSWHHIGLDSICIESATIAPDGTIFWGTNENGIYSQSTNGTFKQVCTIQQVISLASNSHGTLFAGTYGGGVFCSSDHGSTWTNINNNSPARYIYSILIDRADNIYASTFNFGVIHSTNNGNNWDQFFSGLGGIEYYSLAISPEGRLYVGSDNGLYRSTSKISLPHNPLPKYTTPFLSQNYPNPFNSISNITFYTPSDKKILITLYDLLGREIMTLANSFYSTGWHSVSCSSEGLASGIYIYRMQSDSFSDAKKIVVLK
jgi:photosystem II stability/assembly factor-like uncharacterized protein